MEKEIRERVAKELEAKGKVKEIEQNRGKVVWTKEEGEEQYPTFLNAALSVPRLGNPMPQVEERTVRTSSGHGPTGSEIGQPSASAAVSALSALDQPGRSGSVASAIESDITQQV